MSGRDRLFLLTTVFLAVVAVVGGVRLAVQHSRNKPVEIALYQTNAVEQVGQLYVVGAVANPGIYSLKENDTIQTILLNVGLEPDADLTQVRLNIPRAGEIEQVQKIDINRAETWLLEALPGIGEVRAQAIVGYREEQGPFRRIEELLKVSGIGPATFDSIKDHITVSDC